MTTATALPQGDDQLVPFPPAPTPSISEADFGSWVAYADEKERVHQEALSVKRQQAISNRFYENRLAELTARWRQLDTEQSSLGVEV